MIKRGRMKNDKRGQFFIIAAIFISLVLFSMANVATYLDVKPEPQTIFDVSSELNRETYNIIEYGVYNKKNLTLLGDSFAGDDVARYFLKKTNDANIVFVYGNKSDLQALHFQAANTGTITIGGANFKAHNSFSKKGKLKEKDGFAIIKILGKDYFFELKDNEVFYFIIVQKRGDEIFVERDKENKGKDKENRPGGGRRNPGIGNRPEDVGNGNTGNVGNVGGNSNNFDDDDFPGNSGVNDVGIDENEEDLEGVGNNGVGGVNGNS